MGYTPTTTASHDYSQAEPEPHGRIHQATSSSQPTATRRARSKSRWTPRSAKSPTSGDLQPASTASTNASAASAAFTTTSATSANDATAAIPQYSTAAAT